MQYRFPGEGRMYLIVEYFADGACYRAKKKFREVKTKKISGLPIRVQSIAYEDEQDLLHVKIGSIANLRQLAEQLWPLGGRMNVYYNPNNPKKCYVDRPVSGSFVTVMFIIMGFVAILSGLTVFFMMQI